IDEKELGISLRKGAKSIGKKDGFGNDQAREVIGSQLSAGTDCVGTHYQNGLLTKRGDQADHKETLYEGIMKTRGRFSE
ncbi:hypothetical protein V6N11_039555, partial [Hibiscus sabdariffa]